MKKSLLPILGIAAAAVVAVAGIAIDVPLAIGEPEAAGSALEAPAPVAAEAEQPRLSSESNVLIEAIADFGETLEFRTSVPEQSLLQISETETDTERAKAPARAAISSVDDICGDYVQMSYTLVAASSGGYDNGNWTTISRVEGTDSITIDRFMGNFSPSLVVKGLVDVNSGTITFPTQVVTTIDTYGDVSLATCTSTGAPDRETPLTATIDADGTISIDGWWGLFIDSGTYADRFLYAYYGTTYSKCNGRIDYTRNDTGYYYKVRIEQTLDNVVTVKNFANYGMGLDMTLSTSRVASIPASCVGYMLYNSSVGGIYPISGLVLNTSGNLTGYTAGITTNAADESENTKITWGQWSLLIPSTVWFGERTDGTLSYTDGTTFVYPHEVSANWEGEGTEASPYLIKTVDDMVALSNSVNNDSNYTYQNAYGSTYTRVYLGKHFKLANDIDMGTTRFTPIGCDWKHYFAGSFDGDGHTLTGINELRTGTYGFGGVFGRTDTTTVIKNLNVADANISASYMTGGIVGWSLGKIENCKVSNSTLLTTGTACGGISGDAVYIDGCSVDGCTVTGLNGYIGGITGEVVCTVSITNPGERGVVKGCNVFNTTVNGSSASNNAPMGGVAGNCHTSDVTNSSFAGILNGAYVHTNADSYPTMDCGGVVGVGYRAEIKNCFATGYFRIYGSSARIGGVVGNLRGNVTNCYATGYVYGYSSKCSGGLTGYVNGYKPFGSTDYVPSTVTNSYCANVTKAETYLIDNETEPREIFGTIGTLGGDTNDLNLTAANCYYNRQLTNFGGVNYGIRTENLTTATGPDGFNAADWVFSEGAYPRIKGMEDTDAAHLSASAVNFSYSNRALNVQDNTPLTALGNTKFYLMAADGSGVTESTYASITNNSEITIGTEAGDETLLVTNGAVYYPMPLKIAPRCFDGGGIEDDPYLLRTKEDLIKLSELTTTTGLLYDETYFKITNDIDLEKDPAFLGICANADVASNEFEGTIDGGGYTIHNMLIPGLVWDKEPTETTLGTVVTKECDGYKGFIGRLGPQGTLKNINFAEDCGGWVWATTGVAVGYNYGTVDNVRNYASIKGVSCWIGGIVGQCIDGSSVTNCFNAGDISSSYMDAGGIVGAGYGYIGNCVNTGEVSVWRFTAFRSATKSFSYAGGIAGGSSAMRIENCANFGRVYASTGYAGGIAGNITSVSLSSYEYQNDIIGCVNYGIVETADHSTIGGIAGKNKAKGQISNNYYDTQVVPFRAIGNASNDGVTAAETSTLISGTALDGLSADLWDYQSGMYPVLKQFADEPTVVSARKTIVTMPTGYTASDLRATSTLTPQDGLAWSIVKGDAFAIAGTTLYAPAEVEDAVNDTLVATWSNYVKRIPISAKPVCPLAGEGTEASPWLINNAEEWVAFANWQQLVDDNLEGSYARLEADIDFSETEFVSFGSDATPWSGTFLGNNKTVKNIDYVTSATYESIFNIIGEGGVVKDVTFQGTIGAGANYTGGVVGNLYGSLDNVVSEMTVEKSGTKARTYMSGVCAYCYDGATLNKVIFRGSVDSNGASPAGVAAACEEGVTFTDCGNEGTVKYTGSTEKVYIGGLVSYAAPCTFIRCYNKGTVEVSLPTTSSYMAGIVANCGATEEGGAHFVFDQCWNEGSLKAKAIIGGITCNASTTVGGACMDFTGCYNTGEIYAAGTKATSGSGVAGIAAYYTPGSTFTDCYNTGNITNDKSVYTSGIAAYYKGSATEEYPVTVTNCYNTGVISGLGNQSAGIMAYAGKYTTIDGCYNTGDINTGKMGGGIACAFNGDAVIRNCWNSGAINGDHSLGGIYGWGTGTTVENCVNAGDVSANLTGATTLGTMAYATGGIAGRGNASFTNCYNIGNVSGECQVGGLVGRPSKSTTMLRNCYNAGTVSASQLVDGAVVACPDTCGYLIGVDPNNVEEKYWTSENVIENCYYLNDVGTVTNLEPGGTGVTTAEMCNQSMGDGYYSSDYCMPMLNGVDPDIARIMAITVAPEDGDSLSLITKSVFHVGNPEGRVATLTPADVATISGTDVNFTSSYTGEMTVDVSVGEYKRSFAVNCDVKVSGTNDLTAAREVASEQWYTISGIAVPRPEVGDGQVYVVRTEYTDGTVETRTVDSRVVNK